MTAEERAPEQVIRHWLDANGPATVSLDAIAATWSLDHLGATDRRRIGTALEAAGVAIEPPLSRVGAREKLRMSVAAPAGATTAPGGVDSPEGPAPAPASPARGDFAPPEGVNSPEPTRPPTPATPVTPVTPVRSSESARRPFAARLAPVAIAAMVIGAFGPWSKAVFVTDYGTERAGWAVIAVAVVATLLLLVHASRGRRSAMPLLVAILATFAVALVASELRELADDDFVGPAWGAYVAFAGSAGLVLSSVALLARRP